MTVFQIAKLLLPVLLPLIKQLISKTGVSKKIGNKYKVLDKVGDEIIENLAVLKQKTIDEPDSVKKELRLEGLKLGCQFARTFADKLNKAIDIIENVEEYKESYISE